MRNFSFLILLLFSALALLSSCGDKKEDAIVQEWPDSNHTVILYLIGNNTNAELTSDLRNNVKAAIHGLLECETPVNIVIYENTKESGVKGTPTLFRLKRNYQNKEKVDTIMIHNYEDYHNPCDPDVMADIINEAFSACPADIKGIFFGSHALGWAPSSSFNPTRGINTPEFLTRSTQYFGDYKGHYMEVWDLRSALEKCPHLDYVVFDACHMGQVEVGYELRNEADYMIACPTEIMAAGLPYANFVKDLSLCQDKQNIVPTLEVLIDDFGIFYPGKKFNMNNCIDGGTISLCDLSKMSDLRLTYKSFLAVCDDRVQLLKEHPYTYEDYILRYGRVSTGARYDFYDVMSYANFLVNYKANDYLEYSSLETAIDNVVLKEYHSDYFLDFTTKNSCGLGVGIPEIFGTTATNNNLLLAAYELLQWNQD